MEFSNPCDARTLPSRQDQEVNSTSKIVNCVQNGECSGNVAASDGELSSHDRGPGARRTFCVPEVLRRDPESTFRLRRRDRARPCRSIQIRLLRTTLSRRAQRCKASCKPASQMSGDILSRCLQCQTVNKVNTVSPGKVTNTISLATHCV